MALAALVGCGRDSLPELVVYTSQDRLLAEPILESFARQSGIRVLPVFDSEAVKTVGLANRLMAERGHPRCDVFWNNEELRTRQLAAAGVFAEPAEWVTFGRRSRVLVFHPDRVAADQVPQSLLALTNATWRGRVALAYPLFGTTATHFLALRTVWGEAGWRAWCEALVDNQSQVVEGNSRVVQMVARGEAWMGLTDSDDVAVARGEGLRVGEILPKETLHIPNTAARVRRGVPPDPAQAFLAFLSSGQAEAMLLQAGGLREAVEADPPGLQPDWKRMLRELEPATDTLRHIFLR